jgi:ribosomal protein S18 acetylase RimI-like enzyme
MEVPLAVSASGVRVRPLNELDIEAITRIDEKVTGLYRPEFWENRVAYYLRRDPEASRVAEVEGEVVGFMLGDVRGGEFGLEETSGWIERFGVDPSQRGKGLGRQLFDELAEYFRSAGAARLRTLVDSRQGDTERFLRAMGFENSALTALERPLAEDGKDGKDGKEGSGRKS